MKKGLMLVGIISAGCAANLEQLKTRASIDLECQSSTLAIRSIDAATKAVSGCGKEAIYVEQFNDSRHPAWLLNSSVRSTASSTASSK
jgi:hypothetical protein